MAFADAAKFVMPLGKYKGQALDKIAESDEGLRYLDWLRGERDETNRKKGWADQPLDRALHAYLDDRGIRRDLDN